VGAWGTLAYEKNVLSALLQEHREKDLRHKKDRKVKKKKPRSQSYQNIDGSNEAFLTFSSSRNEWSCLESFWDVSHGILKVHNLGPHLWATPIWATQVRKVYIWANVYGPYKKASPAPTMTPRMPPHDSSLKLNYLFNFVSIEQNLSSSFTCWLLWPFFFILSWK
jgi:hypothetical protein